MSGRMFQRLGNKDEVGVEPGGNGIGRFGRDCRAIGGAVAGRV
jgi:hypothetical protein